MRIIDCAASLAEFRDQNSGQAIIDRLADHRQLVISWPVGVGKSQNLDDVVKIAIEQDRYDLVIALLPTRQLINERAWIKAPPRDRKDRESQAQTP